MNYNTTITNVLMIGTDLTSNGGIASVVKSYYRYYKNHHRLLFQLDLLKIGYNKDRNKFAELGIFFRSFIQLIISLFKNKYGIVHCHSSGGIGFYRISIFILLSKLFNLKIIIHLHASNFYDFFLTGIYIKQKYIKYILSTCDKIISLCDDWELKLNQKYKLNNIITISNPVDIKNTNLNIKAKQAIHQLRVIFIGFLIERKGIRDILTVAIKLKENNIPNIKIIIGGKGNLTEFLVTQIEKNNLQEQIEYIGWLDEKNKEKYFLNSDIFFLPSYNEGMPISILEAMAFKLPIISTKIAGIPKQVIDGYNGYLFTPGDTDGYYKVFLKLLNNPKHVHELGQNSFTHVKQFYTEKIFDQIINIYKQLSSST